MAIILIILSVVMMLISSYKGLRYETIAWALVASFSLVGWKLTLIEYYISKLFSGDKSEESTSKEN